MLCFSSARADSAGFPPELEGYEFCGWFQGKGNWTYDDPGAGGFLIGYASGMSCTAARRNIERVEYRPPRYDKPYRAGYTCKVLRGGYESSDSRCTKKHGKRKFRWISGA